MFLDLSMTSISLYYIEPYGVALFPLYLWIIMGYGMRYGAMTLVLATAISITEFGLVMVFSEYWERNFPTGLGILFGLVLLPSFYLVLVQRLHTLNRMLEKELIKSTHAATHDEMTELVNRAYFYQRIEDKILESKRDNQQFTVMFIDLDGFKQINDINGHHIGDAILKMVAERLQLQVRKSDIVARIGGDEFGMLLHHLKYPKDIKRFTQKLVDCLAVPFSIGGQCLSVTASIGVSQFPIAGETSDDLVNEADQAMYQSKNKGKNCFTFGLINQQAASR